MIDIRKRVNTLCKEQGITQQDLADKMGITRVALNMSLRPDRKTKRGSGTSYPSMDTLVRIATALNIDVEDIFMTTGKEKQHKTLYCPHCGKELSIVLEAEKKE